MNKRQVILLIIVAAVAAVATVLDGPQWLGLLLLGMAVAGDQPKTSYTDATAHKRAVSDLIDIIDPSEAPVVKYFGLEGDPAKFRIVNWPSTKYEWLADMLAPLTGALSTTCGSTAVAIPVTDGSKYKKGMIILIDAEYMWVSARSVTTNTITVTRNYGGTQASHAAAAVVTIIGMARLEGADADYESPITDITATYNYTQIFQDDIKVTGTQQAVSQYGIQDEYDYQVAKIVPEQLRLMDKLFYVGTRKSGSATAPRAWGGLPTFVTLNTLSMNGPIVQKSFEDQVQACWENGGQPDLVLCNAWVKRKISSWYADSVRTERRENRGGVVITEVETEFGVLQILMDRWCPSSKLWIVESDYIGFLPMRSFTEEELAKTGDSMKGQVVGEYGLVIKNGPAHAEIRSISTTS